jgi:hypothetical protein
MWYARSRVPLDGPDDGPDSERVLDAVAQAHLPVAQAHLPAVEPLAAAMNHSAAGGLARASESA